ncbi:MAG: phosphomannomutase/phosphoglucomutase [Calditrichaeota bacterium]|nr:MAG: phosphomannomutase/phosphoglucomutase [Calditrichota bacterium]
MVNKNIFREYDIRGIVDTDLTDESVALIGKGFASYVNKRLPEKNGKLTITLGRDVRTHSKRFRDILVNSFIESGIDVIDIGEVTTPVTYYSATALKPDANLMITGSHNPSNYNGFKMGVGKGSVFGSAIQEILEIILKEDFVSGKGSVREQDIVEDYIEMVCERIKPSKKMKVVVDSGNATGALFAERLMKKLGIEVIGLFGDVDGNFPNHHPDPTVEKNLVDLKAKVAETGADLGVGFDGDCDRIGAVSNKGNVIWGDQLLAIFARDVLSRNPGQEVVFDVKCSQGLVEDIEAHGGKPLMWKTGHSLLKNKMKEIGGLIAGEMSGHIFFGENYFSFDDAVYGACKLTEILSNYDGTSDEMLKSIPYYHSTPEIRAECASDEEKFEIVKKAVEYFPQHYKVIDIDGVRILLDEGWGLIRASNTQPVIVLRFEAKTPEKLEEYQKTIVGKLREFGEFTI